MRTINSGVKVFIGNDYVLSISNFYTEFTSGNTTDLMRRMNPDRAGFLKVARRSGNRLVGVRAVGISPLGTVELLEVPVQQVTK